MEKQIKLNENRSFIKYILYTLITFNIYHAFMFFKMSKEINSISKEGKRTMNYLLLYFPFLLGNIILSVGNKIEEEMLSDTGRLLMLIFFISILIWQYRFTKKVGNEIKYRNIDYKFGTKTFWLYIVILYVILRGVFALLVDLLNLEQPISTIIAFIPEALFCVYIYKLIKAMNLLNANENSKLKNVI